MKVLKTEDVARTSFQNIAVKSSFTKTQAVPKKSAGYSGEKMVSLMVALE